MGKPKKKLSAYNRHVQREMKKGRSMKQAAASWSKSSGKPKAASTKKKSGSSRKRSSSKGGKSKLGRKGGFNTTKMFKYVRMAALAAPAVDFAMRAEPIDTKVGRILRAYTGYDKWSGTFKPEALLQGYLPFLGATVATYGIPKLAGILRGL